MENFHLTIRGRILVPANFGLLDSTGPSKIRVLIAEDLQKVKQRGAGCCGIGRHLVSQERVRLEGMVGLLDPHSNNFFHFDDVEFHLCSA